MKVAVPPPPHSGTVSKVLISNQFKENDVKYAGKIHFVINIKNENGFRVCSATEDRTAGAESVCN